MLRGWRMLSTPGKPKKVVSFELSSQQSRQRWAEDKTADPRHRQVWAETVQTPVSLIRAQGFLFCPQLVLSNACWRSPCLSSATSGQCQPSDPVSSLSNVHLTPFLPHST